MANLAIATLGILCYWIRGNFRVAAVIAFCVQWLGAAVVHIGDIAVAANYAPNNAGMTLHMDVLMPMILVALPVYHLRLSRQPLRRRVA